MRAAIPLKDLQDPVPEPAIPPLQPDWVVDTSMHLKDIENMSEAERLKARERAERLRKGKKVRVHTRREYLWC